MTPVLVVNGAVGAGKTTALGELSDLLREVDASFLAIDLDALSQMWPQPEDDPYGLGLAVCNLAGVWRNAATAGAARLVVAGVVESPADLAAIVGAVPGADPFVCRLDAPVGELQDRLRRRELGTGRHWHLERAAELAAILAAGTVDDVVVDTTGKPARAIGIEILQAAGWPHPAS